MHSPNGPKMVKTKDSDNIGRTQAEEVGRFSLALVLAVSFVWFGTVFTDGSAGLLWGGWIPARPQAQEEDK